jgi:hypothetical protein
MPDTITDITGFVVIVECPRCLFQSTITIHVEEMGVGSELPGGMPPPVKKGESDDKPN